MDELAKRFADLAEKYGPNVVQAAMSAARIEAVSCIVAGILCLALATGGAYIARFLWKISGRDGWDNDWLLRRLIRNMSPTS